MPELRKESSPSALGEAVGVREVKAVLSESMKRESQEAKKASTFMEYYNTIPMKNPTNILEKFIKKKK